MKFTSRQIVYGVIAARAGIDSSLVDDQDSLDDFCLDELDFILMAAQMGALADLYNECPVGTLGRVRTVGELVELVDMWRAREESVARRGMESPADDKRTS